MSTDHNSCPDSPNQLLVTINWYGAAGDLAGCASQQISADESASVADLLTGASAANRELARVIGLSTFLLNGKKVSPEAKLAAGDSLDVLPPFAGG